MPEAESRAREVWTKDEAKFFARLAHFLEQKHLELFLRCQHPDCRNQPMQRIRNADGSLTLRCEHADRVMAKAF